MAKTCERRLKPFIENRSCEAEAAAVLENRPFGPNTNPSAVLRVTFCQFHAAEYLADANGWTVVEYLPAGGAR